MLITPGLPLTIIVAPQKVTLASVSRQQGTETFLCPADVLLFLKSREVGGMYTSFIKLAF